MTAKRTIDLKPDGFEVTHCQDVTGGNERYATPDVDAADGKLRIRFYAGTEDRGRRAEVAIGLDAILKALPALHASNVTATAEVVASATMAFARDSLGAKTLRAAAIPEGRHAADRSKLKELKADLRECLKKANTAN